MNPPSSLSLSSRERVNRAMCREDHDRFPRHETFWPETISRWIDEGIGATTHDEAREKVLALLESDFHSLGWFWPHPFPGRTKVLEEDEETQVILGESGTIERYFKHKSGTPEHLGWECDSRETWEKTFKPALVNQGIVINIEGMKKNYAAGQKSGKWCYLPSVEAFECLRKLIGDEEAMISVIEDPEWIADMATVSCDVLLRNLQAALDAGIQPDGIWIYGDMAFNTQTFCSPKAYRELIWPQHKRIADWAHERNMKMIYHTDGNVNGVLDLYVEAGFDCLQPLESKAGMDIRGQVGTYADRMSLFGNIDVMKMLTNDLDLIEEEITTKFAAMKPTKGYMYHSDHSVPPQVSWQTYLAIIDMVNRHGNYK